MVAVETLGFKGFRQAGEQQHGADALRRRHRFLYQLRGRCIGDGIIARCIDRGGFAGHDALDGVKGAVQPRGVDAGTAGALISGMLGEGADHRNAGLL